MNIKDSLKYVEWIRKQPPILPGHGVVEACHLKHVGQGGNRKRPNWRHFTCLPMYTGNHIELDRQLKVKGFNEKYNLDLWELVWIFNQRFYEEMNEVSD